MTCQHTNCQRPAIDCIAIVNGEELHRGYLCAEHAPAQGHCMACGLFSLLDLAFCHTDKCSDCHEKERREKAPLEPDRYQEMLDGR